MCELVPGVKHEWGQFLTRNFSSSDTPGQQTSVLSVRFLGALHAALQLGLPYPVLAPLPWQGCSEGRFEGFVRTPLPSATPTGEDVAHACAIAHDIMSKRRRLSCGATDRDCPTKRNGRSITDFFRIVETCQSDHSSLCLQDDEVLPGPDAAGELQAGSGRVSNAETRGSTVEDGDGDTLEAQNDEMSVDVEHPVAVSTPVPGCLPRSLLDVGNLVKSVASEELESAVDILTDSEKYGCLTRHFRPPREYKFPSTYMNKCNRSFQESWLTKYPWLVYSPTLDGGFCLPCFLFARNRSGKGILVNTPFVHWTKVSSTLGNHATLAYHLDCVTRADSFRCAYEDPRSSIRGQFNKELVDRIVRNRQIMERIVWAILFLGKQGLAFRGRGEDSERGCNPGNFLSLLHPMAETDEVLRNHLHAPEKKNATYLSPQSQNEIINIIGKDFIQNRLISEIREPNSTRSLLMKCSLHNVEQMPLWIRFVDKENNIREEFLEFVALKRVTGSALGTAILEKLKEWQLPVEDMQGQGYDGAKSMSSDRVGCQAIIRQQAPLAAYTHCSGHCLNLVVAKTFKLPNVRNTVDTVREIGIFFNTSPKR